MIYKLLIQDGRNIFVLKSIPGICNLGFPGNIENANAGNYVML